MKEPESNIYNRRHFLRSMLIAIGGISSISILNTLKINAGTKNIKSMKANKGFEPAYLTLQRNGELKKRYLILREMMADCKLCPRECRVNRLKGEEGVCGSTSSLKISSFHPHFGEESPLVGTSGSGTIFFTHCGLLCVFCINADISHGGQGSVRTVNELAQMMLTLQKMGCHNINVVTPTHYSPHILEALDIAAKQGLRLPVAYNTHGWERMEILKILNGVIDIYLADFKFTNSTMAGKYSAGAYSYPAVTKEALVEMNRQVGVATPNDKGILERGLIIRHLVMPNRASGSIEAMRWISNNLPKNTYMNIMSQYTPMHKAFDYPEIARRITRAEYNEVVDAARSFGLTNLDIQG